MVFCTRHIKSYLRLRQQPATALGNIKNLSKIIEKSFKNPSKIYQNPSKINQKSIKISSWGFLVPKRPQDRPKTLPSPKTGTNGPPTRAPFWKDFGAMLAPRATKRPFKKHTKFSLIWKSIFHRFSSILAEFWKDLGAKLTSKILRKWCPVGC